MPVYKDARITLSQSISEKNGRNLIMESRDSAEKIAAFYKAGLESNGWKMEGAVAMGELNMLTATKGGKQVVVQINNSKRSAADHPDRGGQVEVADSEQSRKFRGGGH